jgi:hypothetical protein
VIISVDDILGFWNLPWPDADGDGARLAAEGWRSLHASLSASHADNDTAVATLTAANTGPAMDAFNASWSRIGGSHPDAAYPALIAACAGMAEDCEAFATAADEVKQRLRDTALQAIASVTATVLFSLWTGPLAELLEAALDARFAEEAWGTVNIFRITSGAIAARVTTYAVSGALSSIVSQGVVDLVRMSEGERPTFSVTQVALGAATGGIAAGVGKAGVAAADTAAAKAGESLGADFQAQHPDLAAAVEHAPDVLRTRGGKIVVGLAGSEAAHRLTGQGDLTPKNIASTVLAGALKPAPQPSQPPPPDGSPTPPPAPPAAAAESEH